VAVVWLALAAEPFPRRLDLPFGTRAERTKIPAFLDTMVVGDFVHHHLGPAIRLRAAVSMAAASMPKWA
jgi:hypothetical protein